MSPMRWAARYAFADELWRERSRVIVDPQVEAVLLGDAEVGDATVELVDALVPASGGGPSVWMVVEPKAISRLSRERPGTTFVSAAQLSEVVAGQAWDTLLIDVAAVVAKHADEPSAAVWSLFERLQLEARQGRAVVVVAPAREEGSEEAGLEYNDVAELVSERLGGGRVFGLYAPPMAAVVDFGGRIDPSVEPVRRDFAFSAVEDDETVEISVAPFDLPLAEAGEGDREKTGATDACDGATDAGEEDEDDVPLIYDNTLGAAEPSLVEYIVVAADADLTDGLGEGLNLIELPAGSLEVGLDEDASLLNELRRAQLDADRAALERQKQRERADQMEQENERLRALLEQAGPVAGSEGKSELEAALAREQALQWKVGQLEHELAEAVARPVGELEAEVARLRAEVEALREQGPSSDEGSEDGSPSGGGSSPGPNDASGPEGPGHSDGADAGSSDLAGLANGAGRWSGASLRALTSRNPSDSPSHAAMVRVVDGLVRRIERGGIGTLQLRRELVELRQRLTSARRAEPASTT